MTPLTFVVCFLGAMEVGRITLWVVDRIENPKGGRHKTYPPT